MWTESLRHLRLHHPSKAEKRLSILYIFPQIGLLQTQ
mgnify:CR=1 FL=1|jgi:hypothetical protein